MVPAIEHAATAVQCRAEDVALFRLALDTEITCAVGFWRVVQAALGAGCHTAGTAHVRGTHLLFFDERTGKRRTALTEAQLANPNERAREPVRSCGLA